MSEISVEEIKRQYRVLGQTLEMHSILRDRYSRWAKVAEISLLVSSVIFCATTFAKDDLYTTLGLDPATSPIILGVVSVIAFSFSLALIVLDWPGKTARHMEAAERLSVAWKKFRELRSGSGSWDEDNLQELSNAYWEADRNITPIPNDLFNSLKGKHLRKIEISKLKSTYPGCPRILLWFFVRGRDSKRALIQENNE